MKKLLIRYLGIDVKLIQIKNELTHLYKKVNYLDEQVFELKLKQNEMHRQITKLKANQ